MNSIFVLTLGDIISLSLIGLCLVAFILFVTYIKVSDFIENRKKGKR